MGRSMSGTRCSPSQRSREGAEKWTSTAQSLSSSWQQRDSRASSLEVCFTPSENVNPFWGTVVHSASRAHNFSTRQLVATTQEPCLEPRRASRFPKRQRDPVFGYRGALGKPSAQLQHASARGNNAGAGPRALKSLEVSQRQRDPVFGYPSALGKPSAQLQHECG